MEEYSKKNIRENQEIEEALFLRERENCFGIYQLKDDRALRDIRYENTEYLQGIGAEIERKNYDLLYVDRLAENETLDDLFYKFNMERPQDFVGHSLSVSDIIVMREEGETTAYYVDSFGFTEVPGFTRQEMPVQDSELAFSVGNRYLTIQECDGGYDYSILDENFQLLDGGVYDNPDLSIYQVVLDLTDDLKQMVRRKDRLGPYEQMMCGTISDHTPIVPENFEEVMEKAEEQEMGKIKQEQERNSVVEDFREETEVHFKNLQNQTARDVELSVMSYVQSKLEEEGIDAQVVDAVVVGSRCRGLEQEQSDVDVAVEFTGDISEDAMFDLVHEDGLYIGGVLVDINPITEGKTGTLEDYLQVVEAYLTEKAVEVQRQMNEEQNNSKSENQMEPLEQEVVVTFTVAECSEFVTMGEYHEDIPTIEEAIEKWENISPERMHGIPSIGVNRHVVGNEDWQDESAELYCGGVINEDYLNYMPELRDDPRVQEALQYVKEHFPNAEVHDLETRKMRGEEYKPLKKIEELEEQNYNMIDEQLNNLKAKEEKLEKEEKVGKGSLKEKLGKKREVVGEKERER